MKKKKQGPTLNDFDLCLVLRLGPLKSPTLPQTKINSINSSLVSLRARQVVKRGHSPLSKVS